MIEVRRADRRERPVHLTQNPMGNTFRRYNEGDYRCSDSEVRRMLSDGDDESFDQRILPLFGTDDIHRESLAAYRNRFRSRSETHPWGGIVMEQRSDRLELSNPGTLLVSFEQAVRGGVSQCRNRTLQTMFGLIGLGEKAGSGIAKMREGWRSQQWRMPFIGEQLQPDRVNVTMLMVSLLPEMSVENLKVAIGEEFERLHIDEVQALVTADVEGAVSNPRLQQMTDTHPSDITKMLKRLVERGFLRKSGHGRGSLYRIGEGATRKGGVSPGVMTRTPGVSDRTPGASEGASGVSTLAPGASERKDETGDLLVEIAKPARDSRRLSPEEMQRVIRNLCELRELTSAQIAELVGRSVDRVQRHFLKPMVDASILVRKYADEPNHPQQAYRAATSGQMELFE